MRTVFLAWDYPFPPTRGDHYRAAGLISGLAALGPVTVVTFSSPGESTVKPPANVSVISVPANLPARVKGVLARTSLPQPLGVRLYWSPDLARRVSALLQGEYDLAVCYQIRAAFYGRAVEARRRILELTDSLARYRALAGRGVSTLDTWRRALLWAGVEDLERFLPAHFDETWVVSPEDARYLRDVLGVSSPLRVVPQGCWPPVDLPPGVLAHRRSRPPRALFLGNLAYPPNRDAVRYVASEVLPALARRWSGSGTPPPEVWVAGGGWRGAPGALPALRFLGFVPDLASRVAEVDLSLNPVRFGSGARSKVPESWRLGLPVVSSRVGAEGFRPGPALRIADGPEELADAVHALLSEEAAYSAAVADALGRCREESWEKVVRAALGGG